MIMMYAPKMQHYRDHVCIHQGMPSVPGSYMTLCQPEPYGMLKMTVVEGPASHKV